MSLLLQKNTHVNDLLDFTHNRRLRDRFFMRMEEYKNMWKSIQIMSRSYDRGYESVGAARVYGFLPAIQDRQPPRDASPRGVNGALRDAMRRMSVDD